jgi:hypothetical protein
VMLAKDMFRIRMRHVVVLFATIIAIHVISGVVIYRVLGDWPERGQFGDQFGAVNALFSGLAFAGVIVTILLQREELQLQRQELEQTREELRRSASAQEASEKALAAQAEASKQSAKLSRTEFLLLHYSNRLKSLQGNALRQDDPRILEIGQLNQKIEKLKTIINTIYGEVINE